MREAPKVGSEKILSLIQNMPTPFDSEKSVRTSIKKVKKEGYIVVKEVSYYVQDMHRYTEGKDEWFELQLVSLSDGKICYLEWEEDDVLEISFSEGILKLRDIGISINELVEVDDEEEGSFVYQGSEFYYEDSDVACFHKGCSPEGIKYYYWDFEAEDGRCIGVECWDGKYDKKSDLPIKGGEYEASLSFPVDESDIRILVMGG